MQYNRERPAGWCSSRVLLKVFGLERNKEGWVRLLAGFGFVSASQTDIQMASQRRRAPTPKLPLRDDGDEDPGLEGFHVGDEVTLTPLGNGLFRKTVRSIYQLR